MIKLLVLLALFSQAYAEVRRAVNPAEVNAVGCSLFDQSGNLLKKYLGWICSYFPNGKMLLGDGFTLTFYNTNMDVIWSKDVHTHHMINYSLEDRTALVIASNILHGDTRIDRLEVYDIEGHLLRSFDFKEADSLGKHAQTWDSFVFPQVKQGLTMIESFHRIGKNQSKSSFLAAGNYLASDAAGMIYFFDRKLKKIIHRINVRDWKLGGLRDVQITKGGNLLFYNSGNFENGVHFTTLEERDPVTGLLVWSYRANPPESFYGKYEGNVQILPNDNILFSVVMDEVRGSKRRISPMDQKEPWGEIQGMHRSFEITRTGKPVWAMVLDGSGLSGMPNVVRRLNLSGYFHNKKHF